MIIETRDKLGIAVRMNSMVVREAVYDAIPGLNEPSIMILEALVWLRVPLPELVRLP